MDYHVVAFERFFGIAHFACFAIWTDPILTICIGSYHVGDTVFVVVVKVFAFQTDIIAVIANDKIAFFAAFLHPVFLCQRLWFFWSSAELFLLEEDVSIHILVDEVRGEVIRE